MTLGAFGNLRPLIQYGARVLVPILQARAHLQHRAGVRSQPTSSIAPKLAKLASIISSALSLWGLIALERAPPPTPRLLTIEWIQGWSMSTSSPLQQLSFLRTTRHVTINDGALAHLREDRAFLVKRQHALDKLSTRGKLRPQEHAELAHRWDAWYNELTVNLGYLPAAIHWFGFAAAILSFRSGRKTTTFPLPPPPVEPSEDVLPSYASQSALVELSGRALESVDEKCWPDWKPLACRTHYN
ncbi:hypothetical protein BJY52DRAFT_1205908 [Lactarius psammicola]|nr:hypothetical protein BJY52DRAFT_1205908 [Lactarius psammicola]